MFTLVSTTLKSEEAPAPDKDSKPKKVNRIEDIEADEMDVKQSDNKTLVELKGKVKLIGTEMQLRCAYAEGKQNEKGEFEMGYATGDVRIFLSDTTLIGDRLDYDPKTKLIILTSEKGQPQAYRGGKVIRADRIIYDMNAPKPKEGDPPINVKFRGKASVKDAEMPAEHAEIFPPVATKGEDEKESEKGKKQRVKEDE